MLAADIYPGGNSELTYDAHGVLHLAYYDADDQNLKYATRSAKGDWSSPLTLDDGKYTGLYANIATDGDRVAISYFDAWNGDLKAAVLDAGDWSSMTLDTGVDSGGSEVTGMYTSAAFGNRGELFVSYYDYERGDLRLAELRADGSVHLQTVDSKGDVGRHSSIAVDPQTGGWLVGYESTSENQVRLARQIVPTPQQQRDIEFGRIDPLPPFRVDRVDAMDRGAAFVSVALNPNRQPAVAFLDAGSENVRFASLNDFGWTRQTVLPGEVQGYDTSLWWDAGDRNWKLLTYNAEQAAVQLTEGGLGSWRTGNVLYDARGSRSGAAVSAATAPGAGGGGNMVISYVPEPGSESPTAAATFSSRKIVDRVATEAVTGLGGMTIDGQTVRLGWYDASERNTGYRVDVSADGGRTWRPGAEAGPDDTAVLVDGLDLGHEYAFRVSSVVDGVSGGSTPVVFASTSSQDTTGWYRISSLGGARRGNAGSTLHRDGMGFKEGYDAARWIYAGSWRSAVYGAIGGTTQIRIGFDSTHYTKGEIVDRTFPNNSKFMVGTRAQLEAAVAAMGDAFDPEGKLPKDKQTKLIVMENSHHEPSGSYQVDQDFDDFWWEVGIAGPGTCAEVAPDVMATMQKIEDLHYAVVSELSPIIIKLRTETARGSVFWDILKDANFANANANLLSLAFSPRAALDAGIAITAVAADKAFNANGFVGRAANGRFAKLAESTKNALKFAGWASIGLPVLDWAANTAVANILDVHSTAALLDGVSEATSAATITNLSLLDIYNKNMMDGGNMVNAINDFSTGICACTPGQIESKRAFYEDASEQLQQWYQANQDRWKGISRLADNLKSELDTLQGFIRFTL